MTDLNENAATPADVAVLVERLSRLSGNSVLAKSCREAATTLLSLSARIEALEAENEHYKEIGSLAVKFRLDDDVFVETRGAGVWQLQMDLLFLTQMVSGSTSLGLHPAKMISSIERDFPSLTR